MKALFAVFALVFLTLMGDCSTKWVMQSFDSFTDGDIKNCHGHTCPEGTVTCSSQTGNKDGSEKQLLTTVTCEGKDGKVLAKFNHTKDFDFNSGDGFFFFTSSSTAF